MKGVIVPQPVRKLIIDRVDKGDLVDDLAIEFSLYPNTIRRWLRENQGDMNPEDDSRGSRGSGGSGDDSHSSFKTGQKKSKSPASLDLQISKLQREKQQLLEIIGELTVLTQQSKKSWWLIVWLNYHMFPEPFFVRV